MATCYTSYELPIHQQHLRTIHLDTKVISVSAPAAATRSVTVVPTMIKEHHSQKDFTRPLHVDCSVEYELPNQAKPPQGVQNEPLLMIHPCYFRKIESQRQSLFVNNMPAVVTTITRHVGTTANTIPATSRGRTMRGGASCSQYQLVQPEVSQQAATPFQRAQEQYDHHQLWEPLLPPIIPTSQNNYHRSLNTTCNPETTICPTIVGINDRWASTPTATAADLSSRSPDRPEIRIGKHRHQDVVLNAAGKYRQYLRPRRLHPYDVSSGSIPIASIFPHHHANQIHQQVCYNV